MSVTISLPPPSLYGFTQLYPDLPANRDFALDAFRPFGPAQRRGHLHGSHCTHARKRDDIVKVPSRNAAASWPTSPADLWNSHPPTPAWPPFTRSQPTICASYYHPRCPCSLCTIARCAWLEEEERARDAAVRQEITDADMEAVVDFLLHDEEEAERELAKPLALLDEEEAEEAAAADAAAAAGVPAPPPPSPALDTLSVSSDMDKQRWRIIVAAFEAAAAAADAAAAAADAAAAAADAAAAAAVPAPPPPSPAPRRLSVSSDMSVSSAASLFSRHERTFSNDTTFTSDSSFALSELAAKLEDEQAAADSEPESY